jgi:hypothetical protein
MALANVPDYAPGLDYDGISDATGGDTNKVTFVPPIANGLCRGCRHSGSQNRVSAPQTWR